MAERTTANPWQWQDVWGFSQAVTVTGGRRIISCAGQTSVDESGAPQHAGDMAKQLALVFDNLEAVLTAADASLADVVRLNTYTTDIPAFTENAAVWGERLAAAGCAPASTLLGVSSLALPELLVEIEATAIV